MWNCRGVGKPSFEIVARDLIHNYKPTIFIILETRLSGGRARDIVQRLGYNSSLIVDALGFSGGLWMLWNKEDVDIKATSISRWAIHAVVNVQRVKPWTLSSVYASPNPILRAVVSDELKKVSTLDCPISILGDFNVLAKISDKKGGVIPSYNHLRELNDLMNTCNLITKDAAGPKFTWTNKQINGKNIQEKLDRLLTNDDWNFLFPNCQMVPQMIKEVQAVLEFFAELMGVSWLPFANIFFITTIIWQNCGLLGMA